MNTDKTISQTLADLGYGHRPGRLEGQREIFVIATGEVVGDYGSATAITAAEDHKNRRPGDEPQ